MGIIQLPSHITRLIHHKTPGTGTVRGSVLLCLLVLGYCLGQAVIGKPVSWSVVAFVGLPLLFWLFRSSQRASVLTDTITGAITLTWLVTIAPRTYASLVYRFGVAPHWAVLFNVLAELVLVWLVLYLVRRAFDRARSNHRTAQLAARRRPPRP